MATTATKRATVTVTTAIEKQTTKQIPQSNNRISLDGHKAYLSILHSNNKQHVSYQWSFQDPEIPKQHHTNQSSTIEYSAYWSHLDPDEKCHLELEAFTSDLSSSFVADKKFNQIHDSDILKQFGYKINTLLSHTINGCIYSAETIRSDTDDCKHYERNNSNVPTSLSLPSISSKKDTKKSLVRIKKYEKENGDGIIKEALILHYLTIKNIPPSPNICKYIDFLETDDAYFLIQEYGEYISLDELILTAHKYITLKRLKKKHWRIIIKYLFWQLVATLFWMHENMKCCHLNLSTMNILVKNVKFIEHKYSGQFTIDTKDICIKLCDFGESEVWPLDEECVNLKCIKKNFMSDFFYKDPKIINNEIFNPIKADIYSSGMILFKMFTGCLPYIQSEETDKGYMALKQNGLKQYFKDNNILKGINKYTINLIVGLLNFNGKERIMTPDIIKNEWFKNYYIRYKKSIEQKKKSQMERHLRQINEYRLPYFTLHENKK